MKRLLIALLLLLATSAWAEEPVQLARMNAAMLGSGGSAGCFETCGDFLICQNFETATTGYDNSESWTEVDGGAGCTISPASTSAPLRKTQSLLLEKTESTNCRTHSPAFSEAATLYGHFLFRTNNIADGGTILYLANSSTTIANIDLATNDGCIKVYQGNNGVTTAGAVVEADKTYHIWFVYVAESPDEAVNGIMRVYVGETTTRPETPAVSATAGNSELGATSIRLSCGATIGTTKFDQVLISASEFTTVCD